MIAILASEHMTDEGQIPRNQFYVGCSDNKVPKNLSLHFEYILIIGHAIIEH